MNSEVKLKLNDHLELKKGHPCGANDWKIIRYGADIKLECMGCHRIVLLERVKLLKRVKKILSHQD
jgi:hypothetical protein